MSHKTRVLVVDDSALVRSLLSEIINRQPDMCCVGSAADPLVAREMIRELNPDVMTLDVEMPRMDGIDFLGRLMRLRPMPVVMVSTLTERGAEMTLRALELGAVDFVAKPQHRRQPTACNQLAGDITDKIRIAATHAAAPRRAHAPAAPRRAAARPRGRRARPPVDREDHLHRRVHRRHRGDQGACCWACPADTPALMITQHMPPGFTRSYAARLDGLCRLARQGSAPTASACCLATPTSRPAGCTCASSARAPTTWRACATASRSTATSLRSKCCSMSAARVVGPNALGVMLTGMGGDGATRDEPCAMPAAGTWCRTRPPASSSACRRKPSPPAPPRGAAAGATSPRGCSSACAAPPACRPTESEMTHPPADSPRSHLGSDASGDRTKPRPRRTA